MIVLIEAQGADSAIRSQTQGVLDLEVSAPAHLSNSVSFSGTKCDLDQGPAGISQLS